MKKHENIDLALLIISLQVHTDLVPFSVQIYVELMSPRAMDILKQDHTLHACVWSLYEPDTFSSYHKMRMCPLLQCRAEVSALRAGVMYHGNDKVTTPACGNLLSPMLKLICF